MPENMENNTEIVQENSNNSEINQENPKATPNIESPNDKIASLENSSEQKKETEEELPLPEPDILPEEGKKKKDGMPKWAEKRLERERIAAERKDAEAHALKAENERLRALNQTPSQKPISQQMGQTNFDPNMPVRDKFNTDEEYFFALSDYRDNVRQQQYFIQQRQAAIKKADVAYHTSLKGTIEEGKEKYKDFDEKTDYILFGDTFPPNRLMGEAIVASEYKSDILYFLGNNIELAEKIANMPPAQSIKEIAKIEARFEARKKSNVTKAPKLLNPLPGNKGSATNQNPDKMEYGDFETWYQTTYG